ncbi:MAG: hypothetical protein M3Y17_05670 [Actinomycetota bacterium]|nr:hypothetical protein [Actinomycetota bacterium]
MSGPELALALSVFLACTVEAVEAVTIVLAVGSTRSWSSAFYGVGAAIIALAVVVAALGPALTALPIDVLRVGIGGLLLVFGLQWLRKAILRAAGLKDLHDETAAFARETTAARGAGAPSPGLDAFSFAVAFKGVLLEGLEVAFIVLTFGANQHRIGLAAIAAALAIALVVGVGFAARAPLARVPENAMKFAVGVMLTSFGMFWGTEGAGASWPGADAALLVIIPVLLAVSLGMVVLLKRTGARSSGLAYAGARSEATRAGGGAAAEVGGGARAGSSAKAGTGRTGADTQAEAGALTRTEPERV